MHPHRLRAPSFDGALLADPPLAKAAEALEANALRLNRWDHDFQGRRADRLRAMARSQVIALARTYHQANELDWPDPPGQPPRLVVTGTPARVVPPWRLGQELCGGRPVNWHPSGWPELDR